LAGPDLNYFGLASVSFKIKIGFAQKQSSPLIALIKNKNVRP
jgi:hypothetical protein